jgi:CHASE3 domain sensor protein
MISIGIFYISLKKNKIMKENWYKSREEIKREKQQKRRTLATIVIVYVIVCVAILLMNYFD